VNCEQVYSTPHFIKQIHSVFHCRLTSNDQIDVFGNGPGLGQIMILHKFSIPLKQIKGIASLSYTSSVK
jgi:hypothetical protein